MTEQRIYVQPRRSVPVIVTIRDNDIICKTTSECPPDSNLIGRYNQFLCFEGSDDFYIWDSVGNRVEKSIKKEEYNWCTEMVSGFGVTRDQRWMIVVVVRSGVSFKTHVYKSEVGWADWENFNGTVRFVPLLQSAIFCGGSLFWAGKIGKSASILRFQEVDRDLGFIKLPAKNLASLFVGNGFDGELAASGLVIDKDTFTLCCWSYRGDTWVPIVKHEIPSSQVAGRYVPLAFYRSRPENHLNILFWTDQNKIKKMKPEISGSDMEDVYCSKERIAVSPLPAARYPYLNASYLKNRTPEEEDDARQKKRSKVCSSTLSFDTE